MCKRREKGYSLIEISIVLTIIAFIIAGTIGGKSLLDNSKINLIYSELNTIKVAIRSYTTDNNITSFIDDSNEDIIKLSNLVNNGYLKIDKGFKNDSDNNVSCYPSKLPGCWYYTAQYGNGEYITLTLASSAYNTNAVIDTSLCKKFISRFNEAESTLIVDDSEDGNCAIWNEDQTDVISVKCDDRLEYKTNTIRIECSGFNELKNTDEDNKSYIKMYIYDIYS